MVHHFYYRIVCYIVRTEYRYEIFFFFFVVVNYKLLKSIFVFDFQTIICKTCGTLVGPVAEIYKQDNHAVNRTAATCRLCKDKAVIEHIQIPYIFKYLVAQLSSCNINVKMNFSSI